MVTLSGFAPFTLKALRLEVGENRSVVVDSTFVTSRDRAAESPIPDLSLRVAVGGRQRRADAVEQISFAKRLGEEANRTRFHRLDSGAFLSKRSHEDDGDVATGRLEVALQLEAPHSGHLDIEHETRCAVDRAGGKKILGGAVCRNRQSHR